MSGRHRAPIPVGLDADEASRRGSGSRQSGRGQSDGTSKHFSGKQTGPIPILPPPMYDPNTNPQQASDMNREHGTRSKARGNENPFNAGGINKKTSAKGKPVPIPKLNPVQQANFYGTTSRSIHPAGAPSPANSSAQRSGNNKGKQREVIAVDDGDSDVESIEDANDIQAAPPQSAQRPSMSRGKVNRQDNDEDEPVHLKMQISTGSGANATAKPRKTGGKGGVKPGLNALSGEKFLQGISMLQVDGDRVPPEEHSNLVVICQNIDIIVSRRDQNGEKDLQIPCEPHIKYWLACKDDQVVGFMLDGEVTQRVREDWYKAIPSLKRKQARPGRQRFLLAITLEAPMPKARFTRGLTQKKIQYSTVVSAATLNAAYLIQVDNFEAEMAAAREQLEKSERELPSPSRQTSTLPAAEPSKRPAPRKKAKTDPTDGPDKDGFIQTRIQPERSARTNTQAAQATTIEPPSKKALPPKAPDEVMREWPSDGRTEVIITNGDFFRLEEAEYLNDTLIEFGLKYHWFDLDDEAAASGGKKLRREDIHIFNSFFYKKLSVRNKPGYKEANPDGLSWPAYETVKKWTNKVNIFAKKMLIVPINENLHWYLAIILNPGAVLRKTLAAAGSSEAVEGGDDSTEAQKEAVLSQQLEEEKKREEIDQAKELAKRSTNQDDEQDPLDVISSRERPMDFNADSDVEELPDRKSDDEDIGKRLGARSATRATNAGKQPVKIAEPIPLAPPSEWPPAEEGKSTRRGPINPPAPKPPKTPFSPDEPVIMTFDSLSATHATVGKILNKWLVYEALDKAQNETSLGETDWDQHFPAAYKAVRVPGQDNFADCGVYVLHYAIQLMRDDGELRQYVFDQAAVKTNQDKEKNKEKWNAMDMATHREAWKSVIDSLPLGKGKGGSKKDESKPEGSKNITQSGAVEGQSTANATSAQDPASVEKKEEFVHRASGSEPVQSVPHQRMDPVDSRGPSPRSPSPSRSSPLKRSITISPVAAEDGPVNKRRKIIEERVAVQDMCQDSQAGSSPRVDASLLDHDEPMEHQDAPMVPSQSRSASPVQDSAILAVESPEAVEIRHGSHNAMMSLANELSEVKMTEAPFVSSGSVDTASHAPTPPPMSPVATAMEISNVYNRITESTRKETARDRLRRDHDAEPARLPVQPRMTSKASAKASRVHTEEFPEQPEYLDIEQGLRSMFKDTMFKPFRVALDEEKDSVISKLKLHHNLTSPSAPSQGAQSTRATADGGMDTLDETSTNGIAGGGSEVVHVYSDDDEDVKME